LIGVVSDRLVGTSAARKSSISPTRCAKKLIGLTGTLMGGYADDLFNLFYRMGPRQMVAEGFAAGTTGRRDFATRYGVMESIEKIPDQDNACTRTCEERCPAGAEAGSIATGLRQVSHGLDGVRHTRRYCRVPTLLRRKRH
jgi:hypothetical protein